MGSKCKFYIVYLYLMRIMIINRSGQGWGSKCFFSIYRLLILVHVYNLFFRALEILQEDAVVELMVKHVILDAVIATKNLHIIHKI